MPEQSVTSSINSHLAQVREILDHMDENLVQELGVYSQAAFSMLWMYLTARQVGVIYKALGWRSLFLNLLVEVTTVSQFGKQFLHMCMRTAPDPSVPQRYRVVPYAHAVPPLDISE